MRWRGGNAAIAERTALDAVAPLERRLGTRDALVEPLALLVVRQRARRPPPLGLVHAQVEHDRVQPGREAPLRDVAPPCADHAQEHLLEQILALWRVAEETRQERVDAGRIGFHEEVEGVLVPRW
jgi:hypothetical protein